MKNISLALALLCCLFTAAQADTIASRRAEAEVMADGTLSVSTRFQTRLTPSLSDALQQGVVLSFRLEFQLTKPRTTAYYLSLKEWFDPHAQLSFKLSYQPLTSRYRVSIGSLSNYYSTLREALAAIGAIQGWRVLNNGTLDPKKPGQVAGQVRLLLDISELPKPFQMNALGSDDWSLQSDWTRLEVKDAN
ncbi:DUF4390 domain-containing protein [Chromobacterium sp. IIBBL 290-4]|uniref:DUF4390 domain-containing protein n=1 Tax=Chromobacterium sp. IIBBL 290-4 TaxID=2953890 RepID=UPI0020B73635|nr:DUF4390 domain-containing protein [Chromobacterium sp. IIBBL 290-4]UTH75484.1 DUF4390 domain-containing protein [Chromobacterium sp. IIBBL 290-4]